MWRVVQRIVFVVFFSTGVVIGVAYAEAHLDDLQWVYEIGR